MLRTRKHEGFTLIEVTLAIVIGIIMVAGATLIYNQAKTAAGNSKANEKVLALQALVEQYAAQNQGIYPANVSDVNTLWTRQRPDDWDKSPWGGVLGSDFYTNGIGVTTDNASAAAGVTLASYASVPAAPVAANFVNTGLTMGAANTTSTPTNVGGLVYDNDPANGIYFYPDLSTNATSSVKGYALYIENQQGEGPYFVTGGKSN